MGPLSNHIVAVTNHLYHEHGLAIPKDLLSIPFWSASDFDSFRTLPENDHLYQLAQTHRKGSHELYQKYLLAQELTASLAKYYREVDERREVSDDEFVDIMADNCHSFPPWYYLEQVFYQTMIGAHVANIDRFIKQNKNHFYPDTYHTIDAKLAHS